MTNKTPQPLSEEQLREKIQDIFNDCTSGWLVTIKDFNGNDRDLGSLENEIINDIVNSIIQDRQAWRREAIDSLPLECEDCGKRTIFIESDLRNFNTGKCVCGGDLSITFSEIQRKRNTKKEQE